MLLHALWVARIGTAVAEIYAAVHHDVGIALGGRGVIGGAQRLGRGGIAPARVEVRPLPQADRRRGIEQRRLLMPPLQHALKRELALVQKRNKFRVQWTPFPVRFTGKFAQQQIVCRAGAAKQRPLLRAQARKRGGKRWRVPPKQCLHARFRLRVQRAVCVIGPRKAKPRKQQRENFLRRRRFSLLDLGKIRRTADPAAKSLLAPSARKALAANQKPRNAHRSPPFFSSISYLTGKENPHFLARRRRVRSPACFFCSSPVAFATQSKSGKCLAFLTKNDIIIIALFGCFTREIYEIQRRISPCPSI